MNEFLISIVIPCFNVEKYVSRCIDSIIAQTIGFENLQVILVDDASTDNTLSILKDYESRYSDNILVITYENNVRQGGARNVGLSYATAPFIGFVDSDDWIEPDMYKALYDKINEADYDIVNCKSNSDSSLSLTHFIFPQDYNNSDIIFESKEGYYWGYPHESQKGLNGSLGGIWTGLYKRELIFDNEVFFPTGLTYEDNYWISILRLFVHRMYIIDIPYYHYFENPNSTIRIKNSNHHFDRLDIEEMILEKYSEYNVIEIYTDQILNNFFTRYYINSMYMFFTRYDNNIDVSVYNRISDTIYSYFPNWQNLVATNETSFNNLLVWWLSKYPNCTQEMLNLLRKEYLNLLGEYNGLD